MTLLSILITIGLQRLFDFGRWLVSSWFQAYWQMWQPVMRKVNRWLGIVIVIAPLLLVVGLLNLLLGGYALGLLKLIFMILILLLCLHGRNLRKELKGYFAAIELDDLTGALTAVDSFLGEQNVVSQHKIEKQVLIRAVTRAIFARSFERFFAVLFWFVLLGSYGAVLYTAVAMLAFLSGTNETRRIKGWLDWVPLRILAITYALTGHFGQEFSYLLKNLRRTPTESQQFSHDLGLAALNLASNDIPEVDVKENHEAIGLVNRTIIIWVVVVAIFTLGAWLP